MVAFTPTVLREYALLADGERGVVVGPDGNFAWMCLPRWHDDAVFSSLVGGPGCYVICPEGVSFVWGGHYEDRSLVWRSRWVTTDGVVECREALAFPGDRHRAVLLRRVLALRGRCRVRVRLDVRPGFGVETMTGVAQDHGVWTARSGPLQLRWVGAPDVVPGDEGMTGCLDLEEGEEHDLVLEISDKTLPAEPVDPVLAWAGTERAWRERVPELETVAASRDSRHAYAVLTGLSSRAGGMVAAATTSLPERADEGRDFDYRYAWIRDQCYAGQAAAAGGLPLLDDAVRFVSERLLADGPGLRPAYLVDGGDVPKQEKLDLPGYPGSEVRSGNRVTDQFQLDAFGEALLLLAAGAERDRLDRDAWRAVETAVAAVKTHRGEPDAGIWELHDDRWTHSRLICAAGLRAVSREAPRRQAARWLALADTLVAEAGEDCVHEQGHWQRSPGDPRPDAALLLPAIRGAVPADDPRSVATLDAVDRELAVDHYLYRFRQDERPLHEAEGAFLLCGFQMALALHQQGRTTEAMRWFERNRASCGPPGLFTEEFDVVQRQLRGNLPQAFVHALMLEASVRLSAPWPATPAHRQQSRKGQ